MHCKKGKCKINQKISYTIDSLIDSSVADSDYDWYKNVA